MAKITISTFSGENRAIEPKLIPDGQGTVSINQKPGRADLRPWRNPKQVMLAPSQTQRKTIYRMGRDTASDTEYWLTWKDVVHVARSFDVEDTSERTVYTGDGFPKVTDNLALSAVSPSLNPTVSRPLGLPAPVSAPSVTVNLPPADPDEGKYWLGVYEKDVAGLRAGEEFRVTIEGKDPQPFTLVNGPEGKVTAESFAAQMDALVGIKAFAAGKDHKEVPLGMYSISEEVGKPWTFERMMGTKDNFDPSAVTLSTLFSSVGGSGPNTTVYSTVAYASSNYEVLLTEHLLKTLAPGDVLGASVGGEQRFSVTLTGNSKASVITSLLQAGVSAADQPYVPGSGSDSGDGGGYAGQQSGVRVSMGATNQGAKIVFYRNPPNSASIVVTKSWLDANAKAGDKWQITVNGASPVSVTLTAGNATYPPAVTSTSLKQALGSLPGLKLTDEVASGAPQLRIETTDAGSKSKILIKKITPATAKIWGNLVSALLVKPKERETTNYFYVYTYVNDWGWESAPSPASESIERTVDEKAVVSNFAQPPSGNYNINRIRLYRTQAGMSGSADFFFLREAAITAATLEDDGRDLAEVLATKNWLPAPGVPRGGADNFTEPNLSNLTPMWNGMLAGIVEKSVRVCEPYVAYAWPFEYDVVPPDGTPVALGVFGQNLLVLTTGRPVLVSGSSPETLDQAPLEIPQGCVSARSVVGMGNGVAWASNDGLCWYGAGGPRILTSDVMLREDWLALRPHTIIGQMYEGLYYGSYKPAPGQPRKGFMVNPGGGGIYFLDDGFDAAYFDTLQDQLYILRGNSIQKWEADTSTMTATFRSKVFRQPKPTNYSCAEVVASGFPIQFKLFADGQQKHAQVVTSREPFRLPDGFLAMDWQVEVSTDGPGVQAVLLANSMQELAQT